MTAKKALFAQSKNAHEIKRNVDPRSELFAFAAMPIYLCTTWRTLASARFAGAQIVEGVLF
jgi:hypothetical protein